MFASGRLPLALAQRCLFRPQWAELALPAPSAVSVRTAATATKQAPDAAAANQSQTGAATAKKRGCHGLVLDLEAPQRLTRPTPPAHPPSSVPKGTVLTGLNISAAGQDPVAMADEEYPDWVWTLTEPKQKKFAPEEQFSKAAFKVERKRRQLAWNTSKAKSK